jgi:hypothetical protein
VSDLRIRVGDDLLTLDEYRRLKAYRQASTEQGGRCACGVELPADAVLVAHDASDVGLGLLWPSVRCVECAAAEARQGLELDLFLAAANDEYDRLDRLEEEEFELTGRRRRWRVGWFNPRTDRLHSSHRCAGKAADLEEVEWSLVEKHEAEWDAFGYRPRSLPFRAVHACPNCVPGINRLSVLWDVEVRALSETQRPD